MKAPSPIKESWKSKLRLRAYNPTWTMQFEQGRIPPGSHPCSQHLGLTFHAFQSSGIPVLHFMIIFSAQEVSTHFCSSTSRIQVYLSSLGFGRDGGLSPGNTFGTCTLAYCGLCRPLMRKFDRWFGSFQHSNCVDIPPTRFLEQSS